jgi:hypothetical protein
MAEALTFWSSSTYDFSAVSHICSIMIELRLARKVSGSLRTVGSIARSIRTEFAPRSPDRRCSATSRCSLFNANMPEEGSWAALFYSQPWDDAKP